MFTNRIYKVSAGLVMLVVAFAGVSFFTLDTSSRKVSGNSPAVSKTYLPLASGKQTLLFNAARGKGDFYQRHNSWTWSASVSNYPDYAQRHPNLSNLASLGQGASDYYERHKDLSAQAQSSVDLTDYYFRHLSK